MYLAGPITGLSYGAAKNGWREQFFNLLGGYHSAIDCFSPMRQKEFLKDAQCVSGSAAELENIEHALARPLGILTRDFNDVTKRDAMVACFLGATRVSIGTVWEIGVAFSHRKPVVVVMEPPPKRPFPSNEDCAWVAGFLEGDGCVSIRGSQAANYHQTMVIFHVNDKSLLDRVVQIFGFGEVRKSCLTKANNQSWRLHFTGENARFVLQAMYPWLVHKKARAAIGLEMLEQQYTRHIHGRRFNRRTASDLVIEKEIVDRYAATYRGETVKFKEPAILRGNLHEHVFCTHSSGYVVPTLEEAALIVQSILMAGV